MIDLYGISMLLVILSQYPYYITIPLVNNLISKVSFVDTAYQKGYCKGKAFGITIIYFSRIVFDKKSNKN